MSSLSNFLRPGDARFDDGSDIDYRPVQRAEIEPALRLILSAGASPASDEQVLDFLAFALHRGIDVNGAWVAVQNNRILWALLPVVSPGRTMLMFSPTRLTVKTPLRVIRQLIEEIGKHWKARGVDLAQLLIDPHDQAVIRAYGACGFEQLAELVYLQRPVHRPMNEPVMPNGFSLATYTEQNHREFSRTVLRTYEQSMDCPGLNGLRDIEDIIAGHKASGEFDPNRWYLLYEGANAVAVLLLSRSPHADGVELVYLGLTPEARGRGISDLMMTLALASVSADGRMQLSLAVDSKNDRAMHLYFRHGMQRVGSRIALIRDLRDRTAQNPTECSNT
ncbi:MAG TPA: GNAT family N-acetyltransferase [Tepidisphaeraceae bacterium]|jgi:ribosomal protein S18 acetylase RimI-like enzyme|nr:GNAT family N-acetyltransferase [Tepidisphaeraceae bacterium]